jgi:2-phosphoxylose phosphatase
MAGAPPPSTGWVGTCQFPQITAAGLDDSWQHGSDLYEVYHDLLGFLSGRHERWKERVKYRVTTNVITSQVVGMLINGMWGTTEPVPLIVQVCREVRRLVGTEGGRVSS